MCIRDSTSNVEFEAGKILVYSKTNRTPRMRYIDYGPVSYTHLRDSQGHAVGNLHQEDFQVFDKGKPQVITQFEVEQPGTLAAKARQKSVENSGCLLYTSRCV